jgi:CBS domain-containing protein
MIAETLISQAIVPLRTSDTGQEALNMMDDFYVKHLPIVNNQQLLGVVSEDDIFNFDVNEAVGSYSLSLVRPYVRLKDHLYEVMRILALNQLTVVPVVDYNDNYVGVITLEDLLRQFASTTPFSEPGSILVLEMNRRDYTLAEIARIIESEGAHILSCFVSSFPDSTLLEVTLKIDRQSIQSIIATFERFDYQIKASFNETEYLDSLKERYDAFIAYLNV